MRNEDVLREKVASILDFYPLAPSLKEQLKECYVQENTIASASIRLNVPRNEVIVWYYRISVMLLRREILEGVDFES